MAAQTEPYDMDNEAYLILQSQKIEDAKFFQRTSTMAMRPW